MDDCCVSGIAATWYYLCGTVCCGACHWWGLAPLPFKRKVIAFYLCFCIEGNRAAIGGDCVGDLDVGIGGGGGDRIGKSPTLICNW